MVNDHKIIIYKMSININVYNDIPYFQRFPFIMGKEASTLWILLTFRKSKKNLLFKHVCVFLTILRIKSMVVCLPESSVPKNLKTFEGKFVFAHMNIFLYLEFQVFCRVTLTYWFRNWYHFIQSHIFMSLLLRSAWFMNLLPDYGSVGAQMSW